MGLLDPVTNTLGLLSTMARAGIIAPMRPDKYLRIAGAMQRENMAITSGFAAAAQRCPDRAGLVDELGILTWRQIDRRADAFAAAAPGFQRTHVVADSGHSVQGDQPAALVEILRGVLAR